MSSYNISIKREDKPGIKIGWDIVIEGNAHPYWVEGGKKELLTFLKEEIDDPKEVENVII